MRNASSQKAVGLSDNLPAAEKYLILAKHDTILKNYPQAIEAYENLVKASTENADLLFAWLTFTKNRAV